MTDDSFVPYGKYKKLMKNIKRNNTVKIRSFRDAAKGKLFDICACMCAFEASCNCDKLAEFLQRSELFLRTRGRLD